MRREWASLPEHATSRSCWRTAFVIAHRLSTVHNADRIVMLEGEWIAEIGSQQELAARGGYDARLVETPGKGFLTLPRTS